MTRYLLPCLALIVLLSASPARAENLASGAAYSVGLSGYVYRGQLIPGTNAPAKRDGFMDAPPWQGPADTLIDGRRDGAAVRSWFWSSMKKRATLTFDLRRAAKIDRLGVWSPPEGKGVLDAVTARVADSEAGLAQAPEIPLAPGEGGFIWAGPAKAGQFVRLVCAGSTPELAVSEVEIMGQPSGAAISGAPPAGLIVVPPRDLTPLLRAPERHEGVVNIAPAATRVVATSTHYDDKTHAFVQDTAAHDSDPSGRTLVDGDPRTAITSFAGWYTHKTIQVEIDLEHPVEVDRVVVWCARHDAQSRTYLNAFQAWVRAGPEAAWEPVGETRNAVLPGEHPAADYPLASPPIGKVAGAVRIEFTGVAQSAEAIRIGEIEVWGKESTDMKTTATAPALRVSKPVPAIAPVPIGALAPAYDWIVHDRIRALFAYASQSGDAGLFEHAKAAGFNCLLVHTSGPQAHSEKGWPAICETWAGLQKTHGMKVIAVWAFGSDERYYNNRFGLYQPGGKQHWTRTPCPQSHEYWDRVVGDRAAIAAHAGLTGMVVDMEMYSADSTRYPGPCYCDSCWHRFVDAHLEGPSGHSVSMIDRPAWISANGLTTDYAQRQEIVVTGILNGIVRRVREIKPDFLLGNLLDPESLPGLSRGFGTPTMPALVFSELEYHGNLSGTPGRIAQLRADGYPALYVPGFWPQPVRADQLAALIREGATTSAGFWIWSSLAFDPKSKGDYVCNPAFKPDDYWRAARAGNDLLTASLKQAPAAAIFGPATMPAASGPRATVPRVDQPPQTDEDWKRGAAFSPFLINNTSQPPKSSSAARALWDGKRLHLRVACEEPAPETMKPPHGERDDSTLWTQDSIEIFWMRPGGRGYAHVIVNSAGTVFDAMADGLKPEDPGWSAEITAKASKTASGWQVEIGIPLEADGAGPVAPGGEVRFEIARNRPSAGETSCWAPAHGMFIASTNRWGTLVLP
ncbi:MAG: hypothetical protein NTW19_22845 [Planctomycetota bacterium]|nr:hypothetical protein [Planctomycetota bacterium]